MWTRTNVKWLVVAVLAMAAWTAGGRLALAADGTWTVDASGNWSDTANWAGGTVADGTGGTANFTYDITADRTVTLDGDRTIGNLTFTDLGTASNDWFLAGTSTLTLNVAAGTPTINVTNQTATISTLVAGTKGLVKDGAGTLILSHASNAYTGTTAVIAGTLRAGATGAIGSGALTMYGGTLDIGSYNQTVANINTLTAQITGTGTITLGDNLTLSTGTALVATVTATLAGTGGISWWDPFSDGGRISLLPSSPNTYSGQTNLGGGSVLEANANGLSANSNLYFNGYDGAIDTFQSVGGMTFTRALGAGANQWQIRNSPTSGTAKKLLNVGFAARDGKLTINIGNDGHTIKWGDDYFLIGYTDVIRGLYFNNTATANSEVEWKNGLDFNAWMRPIGVFDKNTGTDADFATISGVLSNGGLNKTEAGTLVLTATNTYTGATLISAGKLIVNGSIAASSGVDVAAGATLGGTGFVSAILVAGTVAPGTSIGPLHVSGDASFDNGSTLDVEIGSLSACDLLAITGNLSLATTGAGVTLNVTGTADGSLYMIATFDGSRDGEFTTLNLPDGYTIVYNDHSIQLTPEPATLVLVALGGLGALLRRKARG